MSPEARRIIFPSPGQVELVSWRPSEPDPDQVSARSLYSLMSPGTETTILHRRYDPETHFADMFSFPQLQTGVQTVAVVEKVGDNVEEFAPGNIVFLRRGHGSHHVIDSDQCTAVPAHLDLRQACWAGLAKTAFRAAWIAPFAAGAHVLIVGAGPVGQMAVRWAAAVGCATIAVSDLSEHRLEHARRGGANMIVAGGLEVCCGAVAGINKGAGPDIIVDSTGNPAVFCEALSVTARFGKLVLLGDTGYPSRQCLSSAVMTKGLTIQAVHDSHDRDGWSQRRVDEHFFSKVTGGSFTLDGLIEREFQPEECRYAYELADSARNNVVGILFDWTGGASPCP